MADQVTSEYVVLRIGKGELTASNLKALESNGYRAVEPNGIVVFQRQGQTLVDAPNGAQPDILRALAALASQRPALAPVPDEAAS